MHLSGGISEDGTVANSSGFIMTVKSEVKLVVLKSSL